MAIEATTLINFGGFDSASDLVVFELDDQENETSSFSPGDDVFLTVQVSEGIEVLGVVATHGAIQEQRPVEYEETEFLDFTDRESSESFTLSKIPTGSPEITFLGRQGTVSISQNPNRTRSISGNILMAPYKARVVYKYRALSYRLQTPDVELAADESYPITVVLYLNRQSTSEATNECNS